MNIKDLNKGAIGLITRKAFGETRSSVVEIKGIFAGCGLSFVEVVCPDNPYFPECINHGDIISFNPEIVSNARLVK